MTASMQSAQRGAGPIVVATGPDEPAEDYVAALVACGAPGERIEVVASHTHVASEAAAVVARAAGLLLCGGVDVSPELYGEAELACAGVVADRQRDAFEIALLGAARSASVPVLGICRGLQVINVFLGGTLYQDLPTQYARTLRHAVDPQRALAHAVFADGDGNPLAALLRREPCVVNSSHHQGIQRLAPDLISAAVSADELVEAAALAPGHGWWLRGVQWHPENLVELPLQRALWQSFLTANQDSPRGPTA